MTSDDLQPNNISREMNSGLSHFLKVFLTSIDIERSRPSKYDGGGGGEHHVANVTEKYCSR